MAVAAMLLIMSGRDRLATGVDGPLAAACACPRGKASASEQAWQRIWSYPAGPRVAAAPAALSDGWVVASEDGRVEALDGKGALRWTQRLANMTLVGSPSVAGSVVVVAGADGQAAGLDATTGQLRWHVNTGTPAMLNGPLAVLLGSLWHVVLLSSQDGSLKCLAAADGQTVWTSEPTNRADGKPAGDSRYLAYGNCDSAVHVFGTPTGRRTASVPVGKDAQMAGGLAFSNGRFFGGTRDGRLVGVDAASGTLAWQVQLSRDQEFNTPVAVGDAVVMGTAGGGVLLFEAVSGVERWRVTLENEVSGLCAVDDALFVVAGGTLEGLRLKDGQRFMTHVIGDHVLGPVVNGRHVAVVDDGGNVLVFGCKCPR
jgi:outer membrane protein assembly factor BamB